MIGFEHPAALALLLIPLVVAWLAVRRPRADEEATGTLRLWREVAPLAPQRTRRGALPPPALVCLIAALCAGVLALSGPRVGARLDRGGWRFVVDRSPSMYLDDGGRTRLDVALELARERTGASTGTWLAVAGREVVAVSVGEFPAAWRLPPRGRWTEPDWIGFDGAGSVWLTDRVPVALREQASVAASGGAAVQGRVAVDREGAWSWNGSVVRRDPAAAQARRTLRLDPALEGTPLVRAVRAWAEARGVLEDATGNADLEVRAGGSGEPIAVSCGGAGWSQAGQARAVHPLEERPSLALLECGGTCVARAASGEIVVGWESQSEPEGDGAAFALFWARALDEFVAPGGIALEERQGAGAPEWAPGLPPPSERGPRRESAWLASLAALLALLALALRR